MRATVASFKGGYTAASSGTLDRVQGTILVRRTLKMEATELVVALNEPQYSAGLF